MPCHLGLAEGGWPEALNPVRERPSLMQRIYVKRYVNAPNYQGMIEPEDRSWIVFIANDGEATLWRRV